MTESAPPTTVDRFGELRTQVLAAARRFGPLDDRTGGQAEDAVVAGILGGILDDVDRAVREPLEIFPVCHHSPASALAMVRRLRERPPRVIYLELCEDLRPLLAELRNCRLPVALQAFASQVDGFPVEWAPLSVVAPVTEASAEYQVISYALENPDVELVLVDLSADHVFQWMPGIQPPPEDDQGAEPRDEAALHGDAVGVEVGDLRPRFAELERFLLHHGKVRHWSEWWDLYVEQPLAGADYHTYREVMVLIGSLFRRLTPADDRRLQVDEDRERYMWTRIRQHLMDSTVEVSECLYVCGAFHAASPVEQFGVGGAGYDIPARTATAWLYGLIPSSHSAIETQFGIAPGSVSIAGAAWTKALTRSGLASFRLSGQKGGEAPKKRAGRSKRTVHPPTVASDAASGDRLLGYLASPPVLDSLDEDELRHWSVEIVRLARRNGYLASTADAIAVFQTSILLAGMRRRARPTPYDFQDAAITCIEKDVVPGNRDVRRLCEIMLGGDRVGQVGYDALPPLARDVYDRLAPLRVDPKQRSVQRALMDLSTQPELRACSDLLWRLRFLLPGDAVRVIMGSRRLGEQSIQESWDLAIGRNQRSLIELGYEGITVEQVLEQRLRRAVFEPRATAAGALAAVETAIMLLSHQRLVDELGARAVQLLAAESTVDEAPDVLRRIRRLLAHYRTTGPELPAWCSAFVTEGYAHYCTLLPSAFSAEDVGLRQVAAMLGFLFSLESVALSLGCDRAQLELAVAQSHPEEPAKVALHWAAQVQLGRLTVGELRASCDELLANPLVVPAFPRYLSGLIQGLDPVPALSGFVVEVLSKAFSGLRDPVLLPWLPTLIQTLRSEAAEVMPVLVREAGRILPGTLAEVDDWRPPWSGPSGAPSPRFRQADDLPPVAAPVAGLLRTHPAAVTAVAVLLGDGADGWSDADTAPSAHPGRGPVGALLAAHPATTAAVDSALASTGG